MNNKELLITGSWMYQAAIHSHINPSGSIDVDAYNYITAQLEYVRLNWKKVIEFLKSHDVDKIEYNHLAYFFAFNSPVYDPYRSLWLFCFREMQSDGTLPANGEATFRRLLSAEKEEKPYLNRNNTPQRKKRA